MALPTATEYVSAADADLFFATSFNGAEWAALSAAEKNVALQQATMWLETLPYNGEKCSPTQPLQWPRKIDAAGRCSAVACTELPPHLIQAACELALALHKDKTSLIGSGGGGTEEFKRVQVGSLSVEYFDPHASSGTTVSKNTGPLLFQRFPWLVDLLSCFTAVKTGGKGVIARVRS